MFATFGGTTDTALSSLQRSFAGRESSADPRAASWQRDNSDDNGGVLSRSYGTQATGPTGSAIPRSSLRLVRDHRETQGDQHPGGRSAPNSGGSSARAGGALGWNRADLLNNGTMGWFNSSPPNLQGRVGVAPNTATDVLIGQFVIDRNAFAGNWSLTLGYNDGIPGSAVQFATASFAFCIPAPGALALLGLAGLAGRRRR